MRTQSPPQGIAGSFYRRVAAVFGIGPGCLIAFAFFLQTCCVALAATTPTFVQEKDTQVTAATTSRASFSSATTAGNLIVAYLIWDNTGTASVSDSLGNTFASAGAPTRWSSGKYSAQIFYAISLRSGSDTVTATFATKVVSFGIIYAHEYSGISQTAPLDVSIAAVGTTGSLNSGSATTTNATDLLFGGAVSATVVTNPGTSYTARSKAQGNMTEDRVVTAVGSYNATASNSSGAWAIQMAAFRGALSTTPGSLTAAAAGPSSINVSWTAPPATGLTNYVLQRCQGAGCSSFVQIATPTATSYADTALAASTSYSYRVAATYPTSGLSAFSNVASATTQAPPPPTAPSNLAAVPASTSSINLSWTASTGTVTNYIVQRCQGASCSNFVQVATPTGTTYSNTGLAANTAYSYRVQATNSAGSLSPFSNVASATTPASPPTAPGNLTATAASTTQINLNWTASTSTVGLANYVVQRCQGAACVNFVTIASPTATTYADSALSPGTSYRYQVQAVDTAQNSSPFSTIASTTSLASPPTAPGNLTATAASTTQINLSWTASTSTVGLANYVVQRCQGAACVNYVTIASPTAISYADTALSPGTSYRYQVQAVDTAQNSSSFSSATSATTSALPPTAPGNLTATAASTTQINLSWTASTSTIGLANYVVQRCQGAACVNFVTISSPTATIYADTALSPSTSYRYQVQAVDTAQNSSPFSSATSATTSALPPTAPGNLTATAAGTTQINLSWTAPTSTVGVANYVVQRCQGAACV